MKLNTDATYCEESGEASARAVIRVSGGKVLLTAWRVLRGCASPEHVEAEACLEGLRLTAEWIRRPVCVESDCLNLINDTCLVGTLSEIQAVKNVLRECNFRHIKRCSNEVAHGLASAEGV